MSRQQMYTCQRCRREMQAAADLCVRCFRECCEKCPHCRTTGGGVTTRHRKGHKNYVGECPVCNNERWIIKWKGVKHERGGQETATPAGK